MATLKYKGQCTHSNHSPAVTVSWCARQKNINCCEDDIQTVFICLDCGKIQVINYELCADCCDEELAVEALWQAGINNWIDPHTLVNHPENDSTYTAYYNSGTINTNEVWNKLTAEDVDALSLSGGTVSGSLHLLETNITKNGTPTSTYYGSELTFTDSNDDKIGYIGTYQSIEGEEGLNIGTSRTVNGSSKYNSVLMKIRSNGTKEIAFDDLDTKVAWQNALSMPSAATSVQAVATAAVTGTSTAYAKADHVHNISKATITTALGGTPLLSDGNYAKLNATNTFSGASLSNIIQDTVIDTTASNNGVTATKYVTWGTKDKNGNYISWIQSSATTAGLVQTTWGTRNKGTGSNVDNNLVMQVKNDGTRVVSVSDKAPWKTALDIPVPGTTAAKAIGTAGAGTTAAGTAYAAWDHVHSISKATITTALGYTPPTTNTWTALAAATTAAAGTAGYAPAPAKLSATTDVKFLSNLATWRTIFPNGSVFLSVTNTSPASYAGGAWTALTAGYTFFTGTGSTTANSASSLIPPYAIGIEVSGNNKYLHIASSAKWTHNGGYGGNQSAQPSSRVAIAQKYAGTSSQADSVFMYPEFLIDAQATVGTSSTQFAQYGNWRFPYYTLSASNLPHYKIYAWRKTA